MPLQRQSVDIPLATMQQQLPATAPPVGRLSRIVNAVARKFKRGDVTTLRTEKRSGFLQMPIVVRNPATGAVSAKAFQNTSLLSSLGDRMVAVSGNTPRVLSEAAASWEAPDVATPTKVMRQREIVNDAGVIHAPDSARVGSLTMFVWKRFSGGNGFAFATIIDDDGTVVMSERSAGGGTLGTVKVASDGTRFWTVVQDDVGGVFEARAWDTTGVLLGTETTLAITAGTFWDITRFSATGIVLVQDDSASVGVAFSTFTWTGAAVARSTTTVPAALCTSRVAFLQNDSGDGNFYIATVVNAFDYFAWQINSTLTASLHQYTVAVAQAVAPINITGHVAVTGAANITVIYSFLDTIPDLRRNYSTIYTVTFAGVSTLQRTQRSLTIVSRPFQLLIPDGTYYVVVYYQPENPTTGVATQQATFFLLALTSPWKPAGTWEMGNAYADWQRAGQWPLYHLSSPHANTDGSWRIALTYRATSFTRRVNTVGQGGFDVGAWWDVRANTIGIREYAWGPDHGQALELSEALLLPGPQAVSFDGTNFVEAGITLSTEWLLTGSLVQSAGGAALTLLGTYQYVVVDEWTDATGNRVRGPASPPFPAPPQAGFTLTGANNQLTVSGLNTHETTKVNLTHAVYRTIMVNGVQSTAHYKVSDDLNPIINDDSTATWSFLDTMPDAVAAVNEQLYTDKGQLDHFPPPPFSVGCEAKGRAFVIGPDKAVWFSGEKTEGDDYWFSPLFRIPILTNEKLTQVKALDNFLIIFTERTGAYFISISQLPDATGAGPIPRAEKLPFTSGCTGFAATIETGIAYSSAQGGIWLITRALSNVFIGADVQDETAANAVRGMVTDKSERLYVITAEAFLVFDEIVGAWFVWSMFESPLLLSMHKGQPAYMSTTASAHAWRLVPGTFSDVDITPASHAIAQLLQIQKVLLGGVRGFKRIWNVQIEGTYIDTHALVVALTLYPDDRNTTVTRVHVVSPIAGQPYVFEFPPSIEQVSGISIDITEVAFADSAGFSLEMLGFEVGIEKGLGRLPIARRVPGT